MPVFIPPSP